MTRTLLLSPTLRAFLVLAGFVLSASTLRPQSAAVQGLIDQVSLTNIEAHIRTLQEAGGHRSRVTFTPGNDSAAAYIRRTLLNMPGLSRVELDTFYVSVAAAPYNTRPLVNIVATLTGAADSSKQIVIGAHYDCSASRMGSTLWNAEWATLRAPGADDNATGVAVILELARILGDPFNRARPGYTIKLIAFAAEESVPPYAGKISHPGSRHYASAARSRGDEINGMISVDMIGYNNIYHYANIVANSSSQEFGSSITTANATYGIGLLTNPAPFASATFSDHNEFWIEGYTAICLIENNAPWNSHTYYTANPYYHTSSDTIETLNLPLVQKVGKAVLAAAIAEGQVVVSAPVAGRDDVPESFALFQNYPNPFNPATRLRYALPSESFVRLEIFDLLGRRVALLQEGVEPGGMREVEWRGNVPGGMYLCRLEAVPVSQPSYRFIEVRKMILAK